MKEVGTPRCKSDAFAYDKVGNRVYMDDGTDTLVYTYDKMNQLLNYTKVGSESMRMEYTYDNRGSQSTATEYDTSGQVDALIKSVEYQYDLGNNLKSVTESENSQDEILSHSIYTNSGQRIRQILSSETDQMTINYLYMGLQMVASYDDDLMPYELNIVGSAVIANKVFGDTNEEYKFYLYDIRGSVTGIVDSNGSQVKGYEYDEFGNTEERGDDELHNSIAYTGGVYDSTTDLYYLNARHYDPNTGRFLQQDTYRGSASAQWTQHLYAYTGNNPIGMIDPTGHSPIFNDDYRQNLTYEQRKAGTTTTVYKQPVVKPQPSIEIVEVFEYIPKPGATPDQIQNEMNMIQAAFNVIGNDYTGTVIEKNGVKYSFSLKFEIRQIQGTPKNNNRYKYIDAHHNPFIGMNGNWGPPNYPYEMDFTKPYTITLPLTYYPDAPRSTTNIEIIPNMLLAAIAHEEWRHMWEHPEINELYLSNPYGYVSSDATGNPFYEKIDYKQDLMMKLHMINILANAYGFDDGYTLPK
ncbi:RHS repeat-associated core domain-containing protein [Eubacteriales bacterium OttesenSCG-928-N14]|nr:RHS repeat-associated core domain-containing protein [Eubacteriales bacterium OttesenSCG-928-N14]